MEAHLEELIHKYHVTLPSVYKTVNQKGILGDGLIKLNSMLTEVRTNYLHCSKIYH